MSSNKLSWVVLAGFFAMGCGGGARAVGQAPQSRGGFPAEPGAAADTAVEESAPSAGQQSGFGASPAPSAAAPAGEAGGDQKRAAEAERDEASDRPGLGTTWGETRSSRVSSAPFVREDPAQPAAVATLFYNDASGVRAMARRAGVSHFGDASFRIANGALTVRLLDSSGRPLTGVSTGGRSYVVGEDGERYVIQIRNETRQRIEAVATVDGLDVVDGRPGALSKRGYIVGPFATVEIDGFRQSFDEVAAFRFGSVRGSYASQKGDDRNVGVIGVAFFQEAGSRWSDLEIDRRHDAEPFPGRFAAPPLQRF